MKKLARFLSAVLVLAMVVSLVPAASANAAKNYIFISGTKTQVNKDKKLTIWVGGKTVNLDYMINNKKSGIDGTWSSSKPSVIKVDQKGVVKALKNGGAYITFKAKNGTTLKAPVYARTRATAVNINANGENVNEKEIALKEGAVLPITIDMPVNKTATKNNSASSYKVYAEVENTSVAQVIKSSETSFKVNAAKEGSTKITFVANYTKEANVRKNKYYKENYVTIKVEAEVTESAKQTAVNQITVTGKNLTNVASDYILRKDSGVINIASAVLGSDGKSVVLTTSSANPPAGDYTLTLKSGKVYSLKMTASTPSRVEFGKAATIVTGNAKQAKVTYKVFDQFEKEVTDRALSNLGVVAAPGTADASKAGIIIVTNTTDYVAGTTPLNVTIYSKVGATLTGNEAKYVVSAAAEPYTVNVLGLYKVNGSNHEATTLTEGTVTAGQVYLGVEVRDQYGDLFPSASIVMNKNLVVVCGTATGLGFDTTTKPVALKANGTEFAVGFPVKAGTVVAGTATISATPIALYIKGATKGEGVITVVAATKVTSITNITNIETLKIGSKAEFSFDAYDNNGNQVTAYDLVSKIDFTNSQGITFKFEKQPDGSAKLYGTPSASFCYVIAMIPNVPTSQPYNASFQAGDRAVPSSILGFTSDASLGAVVGGSIQIPLKYIKVQDQYGDVFSAADFIATGYGFDIQFGSNTAAVANAGSNTKPSTADTNVIAASALTAGQNTFVISLTKGGKIVEGSDYQGTLYAAALTDLSNFKVEVPTLVFANGTPSNLPINVYGTMISTGIKVKLRATDFTVVLRPGTVPGTVENPGTDDKDGSNDFSVEYMLVVSDATGAPDVKFTVNFSEKAKTATTCELKADAHLVNNKEYTAAEIIAMFDFKDQYGDAITLPNGRVTVTGTTKNGTVKSNGTASMTVKDADVTLKLLISPANSTTTFSREISVY